MRNQNRSEAAAGHYRPDIDGLRAVAVLPVVFYHYRVPFFSGGYIGVDIFFVISGFLITSLIHAEMREGRFSIMRFYERRVRRIFPALFALLAAVTVLALVILFPRDLRQYANSLTATALFASNIEFWQRAGYFDTAADLKPLLHTWSLAVEEQFYLVWPAILFVAERWGRRTLVATICCILVLSLFESAREIIYAPTAAFYLLPSRMWELMLGAALAAGEFRAPANSLLRNVMALLALALIGWSVCSYTADTPFPGLAAAVPCVGTALLIYVGDNRDVLVSRVLSTAPLVFVGLLSYSLYLWHWPLYVFAKYYLSQPLNALQTIALIALSVGLAWLSYRFVEQPVRYRKAVFTRRRIFAMSGAAMTASIALGAAVSAGKGLPQRYPADIRKLLAGASDRERRRAHCFNFTAVQVRNGRLCRFGDPNATVDFMLWGDSHADALLPAIDSAARAKKRAGLFASRAACPPLIGVERVDLARASCRAFNDAVMHRIKHSDIREVILTARWGRDADGTPYGDEDEHTAFLADSHSQARSVVENHAVFVRGLSRTLQALENEGEKVVIVGPVPEVSAYVPEALAKQRYFGIRKDIRPALPEFNRRQGFVLGVLTDVARKYPVTVLYPHRVLCPEAHCMVEQNGYALYADANHLSTHGAGLLTREMEAAF